MHSQQVDFAPVRFSSRRLAERDRLPALRSFWERQVFNARVEPVGETPLHIDVTVRSLPDLVLWSSASSPLRIVRSPSMVTDGVEAIGLVVPSHGFVARQNGHEVEVRHGQASGLMAEEASTFASRSFGTFQTFCVTRATIEPLVVDLDAALMRPMPTRSGAFRHLLGYVEFLKAHWRTLDRSATQLASRHLCDLLALALGAGRDATEQIRGRGLRAAQLASIKHFVSKQSKDCGLNIGTVAARFNLTPRSVQRLFETDGTTFTKFVLHQRLAHARRMLSDARYSGFSITTVAFTCGFSDISYFNRCFRRRFGATPGEMRSEGGRPAVAGLYP